MASDINSNPELAGEVATGIINALRGLESLNTVKLDEKTTVLGNASAHMAIKMVEEMTMNVHNAVNDMVTNLQSVVSTFTEVDAQNASQFSSEEWYKMTQDAYDNRKALFERKEQLEQESRNLLELMQVFQADLDRGWSSLMDLLPVFKGDFALESLLNNMDSLRLKIPRKLEEAYQDHQQEQFQVDRKIESLSASDQEEDSQWV